MYVVSYRNKQHQSTSIHPSVDVDEGERMKEEQKVVGGKKDKCEECNNGTIATAIIVQEESKKRKLNQMDTTHVIIKRDNNSNSNSNSNHDDETQTIDNNKIHPSNQHHQHQLLRQHQPMIKLNTKNTQLNHKLLSKMYSWTKFRHLNKLEQEILWLVELSHVFVDKVYGFIDKDDNNNDGNGDSKNDDDSIAERIKKKRDHLAFQYILQFMSNELRCQYFPYQNYDDHITSCRTTYTANNSNNSNNIQITSKSMLIRYGIRISRCNTRIELIQKRQEAKAYIQSIMDQAKYYGRYLSLSSPLSSNSSALSLPKNIHDIYHSPRINKRWFQLHDEEENIHTCNSIKFKRGDLVYLFEYDPTTYSSSSIGCSSNNSNIRRRRKKNDFEMLVCHHAEIIGYRRFLGCEEDEGGNVVTSIPFVTYSVLLKDHSYIEHGVVSTSIFCRDRIEGLKSLL